MVAAIAWSSARAIAVGARRSLGTEGDRRNLLRIAVAFLGIADWRFVGPIFIGDTIFVNYRLAELRDSKSKPTQAVATFDVEVVNQDGQVVQRGRKALLVSKVPLTAVTASSAPRSTPKDG